MWLGEERQHRNTGKLLSSFSCGCAITDGAVVDVVSNLFALLLAQVKMLRSLALALVAAASAEAFMTPAAWTSTHTNRAVAKSGLTSLQMKVKRLCQHSTCVLSVCVRAMSEQKNLIYRNHTPHSQFHVLILGELEKHEELT